MSRSLLRQLEQIRRSATYDDAVSGVYTSAVAEPTVSGSLEQDLNVVRTLVKELKGTSDWFGDLGNYFDPTNTDGSNTENKDLNLTNIKNKTLDAKTALLAVADDNSAAGYTVSGTTSGVLLTTTTQYATAADRTGLPIYASTTNSGSYWDEGGLDRTVRVDVLDMATGNEFQDDSGNTIYGKLHDGADFSGSGDGTDVYVRLYANDTPITNLGTSVTSNMPTSLAFVYPYRKTLDSILEHEWTRTTFVSSWEGDVELIEDIQNLWAFTGATDNDGSPQPWNNATGNYSLASDPTSLLAGVDAVNDSIGDKTYTSTYLTSGQSVAASLDALGLGIEGNDTDISTNASAISTNASGIASNAVDISDLEAAVGSSTGLTGMDYTSTNYLTQDTTVIAALSQLDTSLYALSQTVDASSGDKYVESVSVAIDKNTVHALPVGVTYTPVSTAGQEGKNMDVYVDGQLLAADTGAAGANADRDYAETTASGITFRFDIQAGRNITYMIRQ